MRFRVHIAYRGGNSELFFGRGNMSSKRIEQVTRGVMDVCREYRPTRIEVFAIFATLLAECIHEETNSTAKEKRACTERIRDFCLDQLKKGHK